jgi:uncharacterized protein YjbI with pentapeptide repeats
MVVGTRRTITGVENLMANADHLSLLKKGVKALNQWRLEHEQVQADLSEADLFGADLSKANLSEANLIAASLSTVILDGVNFERARVGETLFGNVNLSCCSGLDSVEYVAPSSL